MHTLRVLHLKYVLFTQSVMIVIVTEFKFILEIYSTWLTKLIFITAVGDGWLYCLANELVIEFLKYSLATSSGDGKRKKMVKNVKSLG